MEDKTRYSFRYRTPEGRTVISGTSPTMWGVSQMVAHIIHKYAGASGNEANAFAEKACKLWRDNMYQRVEHSSGYEFHLAPYRPYRHRFN